MALTSGEPHESLPEALRGDHAEPLCADFRKTGDGKRLAFLKIVAGLADLPLDTLVQRDAQRQLRRVMAVTLGAAVLVVIMALLLVMALRARSEAERQRSEAEHQRAGAEGLVEYMLTDLRERLKGVGRPDVMSAVNERAMAYYTSQGDLERLPDDSLERRARVLHAMGEDDQSVGRLDKALAEFKEAGRTTAAMLAKKPGDPERIFGHSQSEYYVGLIARRRSDRATAARHWRAYLRLAQALARAEPGAARGQIEQAYAWGNLCDLDLHERYDLRSAVEECGRSVTFARAAAERAPALRSYQETLANRLGSLGNTYSASRKLDESFATRDEEAALMDSLLKKDPLNVNYQMRRSWPDLGRAHIWLERGRPEIAAAMLQSCLARFPKVFEGKTALADLMLTRLRARLLLAKGLRALHRDYSEQLALADRQQEEVSELSPDFARRASAFRTSIWP